MSTLLFWVLVIGMKVLYWMPLPESPNDTQKETFVYGKDSKPLPCPFCGKLPYDDVLF